jgi:hypothetical protein
MKKSALLIVLFYYSLAALAQNVGINNNDPQTALDINGRLRIRPAFTNVTGATITLPNDAVGYHQLGGLPGTDFTLTLPSSAEPGSFLLIENLTPNTCIVSGLANISSTKCRLFIWAAAGWKLASDTESQLEKVSGPSSTGWRLLGKNANNYGTIGVEAVDLSHSDEFQGLNGAMGNFSLAGGRNTRASGTTSFATGLLSTASGTNSAAFGNSSVASGTESFAIGGSNQASGVQSFAAGSGTKATQTLTSAFGLFTTASGIGSTVFGFETISKAAFSLSIGRFNDTISGSTSTFWVDSDPLLILGNGTSISNRSNAATFYKNGNADLNGFVRLGKESEAAPRIKMKVLTTTVNGAGTGTISHGLTESKILNLSVKIVNQFNSVVFDGNNIANNSFNAYINAGSVIVQGVAGSFGDLIGRTATIVITYQE